LYLLVYEDRAGDKDDRYGELPDYQALSQYESPGAVLEQSFQDGDGVIAREDEGGVGAR